MKRLFWMIIFVGFVAASENAASQEIRNVPVSVNANLEARYPGARDVAWKSNRGTYHATFYLNGYKYDASFNRKGEWKRTEVYIPEYNLPQTVRNGLKRSSYRHWRVKSVYAVYSFGRHTRFRVKVSRFGFGLQEKNLVFDLQGNLMRSNNNLSV